MADQFRVLDVAVDELAANLNAQTELWVIMTWHFYERTVVTPCPLCAGKDPSCLGAGAVVFERRVTMVMMRVPPPTVDLPVGFDPRIIR